jgi:hypothetical protein
MIEIKNYVILLFLIVKMNLSINKSRIIMNIFKYFSIMQI